MIRPARLLDHGFAVMAVLALAGCTPAGPAVTPSTEPTRTPTTAPATPPPTDGDASTEVLIECTYPDGTVGGTFTRLEEVWASTNYVRFEACTAVATSGDVELAESEAAVAETAADDLPDAEPVELYLRTLAACARIVPDGAEGITGSPTSVLEAILQLCPEAPQSGLVAAELSGRG